MAEVVNKVSQMVAEMLVSFSTTASFVSQRCRMMFASSIAECVNTGRIRHRVRHGRLYRNVHGIRYRFVDEYGVRMGHGVRMRHVNCRRFVQQQAVGKRSEIAAPVNTVSVVVEARVESQQRDIPFLRYLLLAVRNRQQQEQQRQQRPHRRLH